MSLNDIDAQLAELKARLGGLDSEASDDESGGGAREESRDNDPKRKSKKEKKSKKSKKERKEKKMTDENQLTSTLTVGNPMSGC